ncbi:3-isopropylmalate dehydratase small subunit [Acuticoccus sp. MNP-M23]|uniref:3-isopropylmalate dehydratase small subunit n=1 Tax=Acuticoccus sp. MNP-M23 TaxID=3072793 RepID=UPI0028169376|nr:3-isopropylmalate dehydratase small subunit [Acuticoccus sp. MNP-M23]WMS42588.1 3-isopropylmalate dehydratase small subunit [Acuticoccus sp. MNP-M23]
MTPFTTLTATACPLPYSSIDTDQLIPARFMSRTRAEGYGPVLLHDVRRDGDGNLDPAFPLNDPARADAAIVVARRNFGCGSSREAAVYALADGGIRAVIAPSFGDIFASNAVNNGLLPAVVSEDVAETLLTHIEGGARAMTVDLEARTITAGNEVHPFQVDPIWRTKLLNGWDDLDLTLQHRDAIAAFASADTTARPWAKPRIGNRSEG